MKRKNKKENILDQNLTQAVKQTKILKKIYKEFDVNFEIKNE